MEEQAATVLTKAVNTLDAAARGHKRAEAENRRRARDLRKAIAAIRASCQELGIELLVEPNTGPEVQSGNGRDPRA